MLAVLLGLGPVALSSSAGRVGTLTGNWTSNVTQPNGPSHIEIWQTGTQLYLRTDAWGATPSTGSVDLSTMTATINMVGGGGQPAKIEDNFSMLVMEIPEPQSKWNWCKFPHCPMPEPIWKPFPPAAPPPAPLAVPAYPPLAPPFPPTWRLNESTIIHTSNLSGWTDTVAAAKYGVVSFDWNNAKAIWLKPNRSESTCEETLVEQARRVKAARPSARVLVYRNAMFALQWLKSERAVMYDPQYAGFFLHDRSGKIINGPAGLLLPLLLSASLCLSFSLSLCFSVSLSLCLSVSLTRLSRTAEGDQFLWNYSNASAAAYKVDVVIGGAGGVGAPGGCASSLIP